MAFGNGPRIVTDGLILSLDAADRNSYVSGSTTWNDLSGNNNSGSLINGPTFSSANGGSLVLNGTSQYIDLGTSYTSLQTQTPTLSFWIKPSSIPIYNSIGGWCQYGLGGGFVVDMNPSSVVINIGNGSWAKQLAASVTLSTLNYTNIVANYDGSNLNIYINGVLNSTFSIVTTIGYATKGFAIGSYYGSTNNMLVGSVAITQMYNRALSATEVAQNYNAQKSRFNL